MLASSVIGGRAAQLQLRQPLGAPAGRRDQPHRPAAPRRLIACSAEEPATNAQPAAAPPAEDVCPTCKVKRSDMARGCDGAGRIMGGLGSVPGFGWWPIKAYRPCGKASAAGVRYRRKGQDLDEVLWGGGKE